MAKIVISIDLLGQTEIEVKGAKGKNCTDLTQALEKALGPVEKRELKAEYRDNSAAVSQQLRQRS